MLYLSLTLASSLTISGYAPASRMALQQSSRVVMPRIAMRDAEEAPAEEAPAEEGSILDSLSGVASDVLEKIKGMTLLEATELIKEAETTFDVGPKSDDDDDAPAEE